MTCKARRCNDEMHCHRCATIWDINDPDPPICQGEKDRGNETLKQLKKELNDESEPT